MIKAAQKKSEGMYVYTYVKHGSIVLANRIEIRAMLFFHTIECFPAETGFCMCF